MTIIKDALYDGTPGTQVASAGLFDRFVPGGASAGAIYEATAEGACIIWTAAKSGEVDLASPTMASWRGRFRVPAATGWPSTDAYVLSFRSSGATEQAAIRVKPSGKLEVRNAQAGTSSPPTSTVLTLGDWYQIIHEYDQAPPGGAAAYQRLRLYTKAGALLETIQWTVGANAVIKHVEGPPGAGVVGWKCQTDNVTIAVNEFLDEIIDVGPAGVVMRRVGDPIAHGFRVTVKTAAGVLTARIRVIDVLGSTVFTTPNQIPAASGYTTFQIDGLLPQTRYQWVIETDQGLGFVTDTEQCYAWTAPNPYDPASFKMALWGCQRVTDNRPAWEDLLYGFAPHYGWDGGDRGYPNRILGTEAAHRADWELVEQVVWGVRTSACTVPFMYLPSDHDSDGGNSGWKSAGLTANKAAYKEVFPHPDLVPLATEDALIFTKTFGRFRFIQCDFRCLVGVSDVSTHMTIGPTITPIGLEQEAWLFAALAEARDDPNIIHTFLITDPPTTGEPGGGAKHDWWPYWPAAHARLMAVLNTFVPTDLTVIQFDNHLNLADPGVNNPDGDWSIVGCAGMKEDTGNWRGGWTPMYGDEETGLIADEHNPLQMYMRLTCEDTGSEKTITFESRFADEGTRAFIMVLTGPVAGGDHKWVVNGEDISRAAFNVRNRGAGWVVPPKRGRNVPIPASHGTQFAGRKKFDENDFALEMWAIGADPDTGEIPFDKRLQVSQNLDYLSRVFCATDERIEIRRVDGPIKRKVMAEVLAGIPMRSMAGGTRAEFVVALRAPQPFWEDLDVTTQTLPIGEVTEIDLLFSAFAGATAPMEHLSLRLDGKMDDPLITDRVSGEWLQINTSLLGSDYLLIDSFAFTVAKWDNSLAEFNDKVMVTEQRTSGPLLSFMPQRIDGMVAMRLTFSAPAGPSTTATLTGTRRFLLA